MQEARWAGFVLLVQLRLTQRASLLAPLKWALLSLLDLGGKVQKYTGAPGPTLSRDFSFRAVQLFSLNWLCSLAAGAGASISGHFQNLFCLRRMGGGGSSVGRGQVQVSHPSQAKTNLTRSTCSALLYTVLGKSYSVETAASSALLWVHRVSHLGRLWGTPSSTDQCFSANLFCMCAFW